ncbi:MAG TPA: site-2 protease family protein [Ktedonobacterales bacterium]|jgi:Zn-dependent protease|nr:site-2 protease family protein [Ktedonobacterales bacterium]
MRTSLHIGTISGIRIEVHISWLIIFMLLTFSLATGWFPLTASGQSVPLYWLTAVVAVVLLFASVLAHELAHSVVARRRGMPVKSITLFIFGGVSNIEREPQSASAEFQMAFVGPLTSLVIGGAFVGVAYLLDALFAVPALLGALLMYTGIVNLLLGVFNLIPGFPMDGGRALRAIIWRTSGSLATATRWATYVGQAVAYLLILVGIWLFFTTDALNGLWIGFIGLFLLLAAQAEYAQVKLEASVAGVNVEDVMTTAPIAVTPELSAQQFVDDYLLRTGQRALPVVADAGSQRLLGIVALRDVRNLARDRWASTPVGQIMTPLIQLKTVEATQPLSDALPLISRTGVNQLPVVRDGRLVGLLDLEAIVGRIAMRQALGLGTVTRREAAMAHQSARPIAGDSPHAADTRLPTTT